MNDLAEAEAEAGRRRSSVIARYSKVDLLCLDEFGYLNLDKKGAKLLLQIFTEREECRATAVATNSPFAERGKIFAGPGRCAAIADAAPAETGRDEVTSVGQPGVGFCGSSARVNPWLRSTFATCSV
ncbi:ATP-binding protein [Streptomyces sp. NPDC052023]|uniref:ATP-binding protein n=1 Tax=Streptomyces sp. NPDC052023 TaxID=3365681 RepID=UPI0037D4C1B6